MAAFRLEGCDRFRPKADIHTPNQRETVTRHSCGMADQNRPSPLTPIPLADRVTGPRRGFKEAFSVAANNDARLAGAAFAPIKTKRLLNEAIEGGAGAMIPLALVHGAIAVSGVFNCQFEMVARHGAMLLIAIICYYAVLHGRTIWPSVFVLLWLLFEICLARWLLGYRFGFGILNIMAVPLAVLAVRASWRRSKAA